MHQYVCECVCMCAFTRCVLVCHIHSHAVCIYEVFMLAGGGCDWVSVSNMSVFLSHMCVAFMHTCHISPALCS